MNKKIPETDSIEELAGFWDVHDLTESEGVEYSALIRGWVLKSFTHLEFKERLSRVGVWGCAWGGKVEGHVATAQLNIAQS